MARKNCSATWPMCASGEGWSALLLLVNVFLLLFAYYLLKTVREALILTEGGAYVKAYSSAGQAALLMMLVPLYGFIGTKVVRIKLIAGLLLFFVTNLVVFYLAGVGGAQEGVVFYIWVGIFNVFVISQVWAFANDIYTEAQGKRLFPMIGVGSSLGAWLGALGASRLVSALHATPYQLQLLAAAILVVCCALVIAVNRIATRNSTPEMASHAEQKLAEGDGFALIFRSRYLTWIAVLIVLLNVVNSTGEFMLGDLVSTQAHALYPGDAAAQKQFVGAFYGNFFAGVNLLGFLLQTFAVSRLFPRDRRARRDVHSARDLADELFPARPGAAFWASCAGPRPWKTPPTTRSRIRFARRCSCPPRARPSTRPKPPSIPSSCVRATSCRQASCGSARSSIWDSPVSPGSMSG